MLKLYGINDDCNNKKSHFKVELAWVHASDFYQFKSVISNEKWSTPYTDINKNQIIKFEINYKKRLPFVFNLLLGMKTWIKLLL